MRTEEEVENEAAERAAATGAAKTTAADMVRDAIASTERANGRICTKISEKWRNQELASRGFATKRKISAGKGSEVGDGSFGSVVDEADGVQMAN